jgi:hypothetical protein
VAPCDLRIKPWISATEEIVIENKQIEIDGAGMTLVGGGTNRLFKLTGCTSGRTQNAALRLVGPLTITNGYAAGEKGGGAIFSDGYCALELHNITLAANAAADNGGAADVRYRTDFKMYNCIFERNTAPKGGAMKVHSANLEIYNSIFESNTAPGKDTTVGQGGALYIMGSVPNVKIYASELKSNTAEERLVVIEEPFRAYGTLLISLHATFRAALFSWRKRTARWVQDWRSTLAHTFEQNAASQVEFLWISQILALYLLLDRAGRR